MLDYQELSPLPTEQRRRRFETARNALGESVLTKLLAFAMYTLGASRRGVAELVGLPIPTLQSVTERVLRDGLQALEDRRHKASTSSVQADPQPLLPQPQAEAQAVALRVEEESLVIQVGEKQQVLIPRHNSVQCRTVLLTFLDSGLLSVNDVAHGLGLSTERVRQLKKKLAEDDAKGLIDQRQGQKQDYLVIPEVKAELIQEFVVSLLTNGRTSSESLKEGLSERCNIDIAARTIRAHVANLGLRLIRYSLPRRMAEVKRTAEN